MKFIDNKSISKTVITTALIRMASWNRVRLKKPLLGPYYSWIFSDKKLSQFPFDSRSAHVCANSRLVLTRSYMFPQRSLLPPLHSTRMPDDSRGTYLPTPLKYIIFRINNAFFFLILILFMFLTFWTNIIHCVVSVLFYCSSTESLMRDSSGIIVTARISHFY